MTTLSTLAANNAGFGNILKTIQSGGAYIDPQGRVLSKTELKPLPTYYNTGMVFSNGYYYDQDGNLGQVPREPLQLYKFESAGDGKFTIPKLRNEKDGGYYADVTLNATKDGGNFTLEDKDTTATGQYFKAIKGTDFSNQQWVGMSRGLSNINSAVQSGEATVDSKKSTQTWDDGMGNAGSKEYYALRDGNGTEVGALYDVPGRPGIKYADVGNETAGGSHYVVLQTDPKTGRVVPIQDFGKQVTYNESQGKMAWQLIGDNIKAAAPVFAMIFAPVAGEMIGAALADAGILTSASAAAAGAATAAEAATATAAATAFNTAVGTGIVNATSGILQGQPIDQAVGNAAINTAIQLNMPGAVKDIKDAVSSVTTNPAITNVVVGATTSATTALVKGKNALDAFEKGGTNALINQIGIDLGFDGMNATAKKVVTDAINAGISGKDFKLTPEYMANTLIATANKTAKNTQTANEKFEDTLGRPATEEELKRFATVDTEEELNQSFNSYITEANETTAIKEGWDSVAEKNEAKAAGYTDPAKYDDYLTDKTANETAVKAGWDSLTQKNEAAAAGYTNPEQYDTYLVDKKADEDAVKAGWTSADQKYDASVFGYTSPEEYKNFLTEQANQRELALAKDNEKNPFTGTTSSTVVKEKGPGNYSNDGGGFGGDTDYIPPTDVVDALVKSGLEDGSDNVDLTKVVGGTDTVTGGGGTDTVTGGEGTDTVTSGEGEDTITSEGGDDTLEGGEDDDEVVDEGDDEDDDDEEVDTTCQEGFHWDEGRQMCMPDDDCPEGFHWDGSKCVADDDEEVVDEEDDCREGFHWDGSKCVADDDEEEESTDCPDGYLYNLDTKSCDPVGGGLSIPPIKLDKKKDKVTTSTTTTNTGNTTITTGGNTTITTGGNTTITTGGNTVIVTGNDTTVANPDRLSALMAYLAGSGGQQAPYTPAQIPVADIKSYYNTIRGIAGEELLPESKEEKDKSGIDNLFAGGGTVNMSYNDVINGIAGERLLDPPEEKKKKSSIEEMFFEGGTVDDLLRILRG